MDWLIAWLNTNGDAVTALAAIVALVFGVWQVLAARAVQREATAKEIWKEYYLSCVDHPELANPGLSKLDLKKQELGGDRGKFYDYQWFVSFMLLACDEVLQLRGGGPDWERFVQNNVGYHHDYIRSPAFEKSQHLFSPELQSKIDDILEEKRPKRQSSLKRRPPAN